MDLLTPSISLLTRAAVDHHVASDEGGDESMVAEYDAGDVPLWGAFRTRSRSSRKIPRQVSRDSAVVC